MLQSEVEGVLDDFVLMGFRNDNVFATSGSRLVSHGNLSSLRPCNLVRYVSMLLSIRLVQRVFRPYRFPCPYSVAHPIGACRHD